MFFWWSESAAIRGLTTQLDVERQQHEVTRRQLAVSQKEAEALSAMLTRQRAHIDAEIAVFARQRAESEGIVNERRAN